MKKAYWAGAALILAFLVLGLTTFSCEKYIGPKGLAKSVINPKYYSDMKSIYERTYPGPLGL